jgi:hypothetical protein
LLEGGEVGSIMNRLTIANVFSAAGVFLACLISSFLLLVLTSLVLNVTIGDTPFVWVFMYLAAAMFLARGAQDRRSFALSRVVRLASNCLLVDGAHRLRDIGAKCIDAAENRGGFRDGPHRCCLNRPGYRLFGLAGNNHHAVSQTLGAAAKSLAAFFSSIHS